VLHFVVELCVFQQLFLAIGLKIIHTLRFLTDVLLPKLRNKQAPLEQEGLEQGASMRGGSYCFDLVIVVMRGLDVESRNVSKPITLVGLHCCNATNNKYCMRTQME
jgi:hypothetical protein